MPVPYWVSYPEIVRLCDATPVFAVADATTGFKLTPEVLEAAITPKTKWLILNTPSNPTGAAYTADELRGLADVLLRHPHVHILTDDIYEVLVYDGGTFATIAQVEPRLQRADADDERRLEVACDDRLAHRLLHRAEAAAGGDAEAAEPVDHQSVLDRAMGGGRGAQRAAGVSSRSGGRCSRTGAISW